MATSGGLTPTPKTKREFTSEQKRLFAMLGVAGLLALGVGAMYIPGMLSGGSSKTTIPVAPTPVSETPTLVATSAPLGGTPLGANGGIAAGIKVPATPATQPPAALLAQYRPDPFAPFMVNSPIPTPLPPPPPPVVVPPPIFIEPLQPGEGITSVPGSLGAGGAGVGGSASASGGGASQGFPALKLPIVNIPRVNTVAQSPRETFPPARQTGGGDSNLEPQPSYNKRLSGYLLSERTGVRALLEITNGEDVTTAVVRPGDEVNGIRVISIQNVSLGGNTVVRMLVREANGQQSYVDLKPSAQAADNGGAGGDGGLGRG